MTDSTGSPLSYATAGVDVLAGDQAVELMRDAVAATHGPRVLSGAGGFAGLLDVSELKGYRRPVLASSTDGVGTKVAIAQALGIHDSIGIDLVAMVVDDLVVCGAKPLAMTDYIACGAVVPERIAAIVRGIARGCVETGTALVGGETAEHPGLLGPDDYDVAGSAVGVVEADDLLGPGRVRHGDAIVAFASSGLHSNGYSLVRAIVARSGWTLDRHVPEFGRTLGEELLEPTALYTRACLELAHRLGADLHALAHITGGGLAANVARVLPPGSDAVVDRGTWRVPSVFAVLAGLGQVTLPDAEQAWNLGVGMTAVVAPHAVDSALSLARDAGLTPWVCGEIVAPESLGQLVDEHTVAPHDLVTGTKGVAGGRVGLVGRYLEM